VYLRPGERQIRRALGFLRALRSRTVSLEAYRAATPLGEIEEFIACPLCGESRQRPFHRPRDTGKRPRRRRPGWEYRVVRCPGCGLVILTVNGGSLHLDGLGSAWGGFTRNHLMFCSRDSLPRLLESVGPSICS
jgi:hypothetical protein